MNTRVIYHSGRSGNTMKVAEAIAEAVGVRAENVFARTFHTRALFFFEKNSPYVMQIDKREPNKSYYTHYSSCEKAFITSV